MKDKLKIIETLKEIIEIAKSCKLVDPNGQIVSSFESDNTQEKIALFENISKLHISLKVGVSNLLKSMDILINCAPDDVKKNINYLYLQKTFIILTESNRQALIWQIAYLNGLLLQNREPNNKDTNNKDINYSSLSNKLQVIEILNVYDINYLIWYKLNNFFLYLDYNLETFACALLKLHFLRNMKEIEFLKDEWIIDSLNTITNSEETINFMESLLTDLEKSNSIS